MVKKKSELVKSEKIRGKGYHNDRGRFRAGNPGKPKGAKCQITRIKQAVLGIFEEKQKGEKIVKGFRDSYHKGNQRVFVDWIMGLVKGNQIDLGLGGEIKINVVHFSDNGHKEHTNTR